MEHLSVFNSQSLRSRSHWCHPANTLALWQRALALVQSFVIQTPPLR
ncbi:hypothetical protein RESH_05058 [Rhodopirellula europaea SH398]|uniref:Uncharacterized protein n=1 Tax=Rhodopirellula europaea SH398 TaxID=1263868 RepID=M5SDZ0_9BACT|nr:hypothetical protein RESH_05058 [Rhodopirellula europaea SH398]